MARVAAILVGSVLSLQAATTNAVLPFANASGEQLPNAANFDWIGESIAESLRESLGARGIAVIGRERVLEAYSELRLRPLAALTRGSVLKVGHQLGATRILSGTFSIAPGAGAEDLGTLTIQAHISTPSKFEQSSRIEEIGPLSDLISLQAHFAWRVTAILEPNLAPPEAEFETMRPLVRLDAEENYIRGLLATSPEQREQYFLQAAHLDIRFWRPAFQLGRIRFDRKEYTEAASWFARVDPADMHYPEANFYIGLASIYGGAYESAQDTFAAVARIAPSPETFNNLGVAESRMGSAHALDSFSRALEASPNDPDYHFNVGYILWKTGQFDAAADRFREVLERAPADQMATLLLGRCLQRQALRKNNPGDVRLAELERIKTSYEDAFEAPAPLPAPVSSPRQ